MKQNSKTPRPRIHRLADTVRQVVALILVFTLGPAAPMFAQAAAVSQAVASTPMSLHITILEGEDSLNSIRERTAREPIVQVEDENHKPVAGALILFTIQDGSSGAGGTFADGLQTLRVTTDANGRAVAHGLKPNQVEGQFAIGVTATLGTLVVVAQIRQSNTAGGGGGGGTPSTPATPGAPGTPEAPGTPTTPGAPAAPGTTVAENPTQLSGSIGKKIGRFNHIPKKVYVTGGVVVSVGVVVGVVVATHSTNPTTITPGTGTVGHP